MDDFRMDGRANLLQAPSMQDDEIAVALEPYLERLGRLEQEAQEGLLTKSKYASEIQFIKTGISSLLERDSRPELVYRRGMERQPNWIKETIGTFADRQHLERIQGIIGVVRDVIDSIQPEALALMDRKKSAFTILPGDRTHAALILIEIVRRATKSLLIVDKYLNDRILHFLRELDPSIQVTLLVEKPTHLLQTLVAELQTGYPNVVVRLTPGIHGRFVVIDETDVWQFDASFKDLGRELSTIRRLSDEAERERLLQLLADSASAAKSV